MILPTTYVFEGLRHAIATGELAVWPLLTALGLTFILLIAALLYFHYALRQAKKLGLLTRFEMA
jgi:ABC-type polysaccharide/polyol phosphate export permease